MKNLRKKAQRGSVGLILALTITGLTGAFLASMAHVYRDINTLHSKNKNKSTAQQNLLSLANQLNQAYLQGRIDPTCSSSETRRKDYGGKTFCVPSGEGGLCITTERRLASGSTQSMKVCASLNNGALDWKGGRTDLSSPNPSSLPSSISGGGTKNRIFVPGPGNPNRGHLWKDCSVGGSNMCVKIALCEEDQLNCNLNNAISTQIVRLGPL